VVSPDAGRVRVADLWSDRLGAPLAIIHKRRDPKVPNQVKVHEVVGQVKGRTCILIDDMIDTGGSICKAADALYEQGRPFVVTVQGGANDVIYGVGTYPDAGSPAVFDKVVDKLFEFCDERHAAHKDAVCIILGPSYCSWYSLDGYAHYNARLRAEAVPSHADAVVYLDQDPRLNVYRFSTSTLHVRYFFDQVHPNHSGSVVVSLAMTPVVAQLLAARGLAPLP